MVVGDIINQNMTGLTIWQPALGVEIMILQVLADNSTGRSGFRDAATITNNYANPGNGYYYDPTRTKLGITNANYFHSSFGTGATQGFSGIQIK